MLQKDFYDREYFLKWNGEILWSLDQNYFSTNVHAEQLEIHLAEGWKLEESGKYSEAMRIYEGILYCGKLRGKLTDSGVLEKTRQRLGNLYSKLADKIPHESVLLDPAACEKGKDKEGLTFLESKEFGVEFAVPVDFRFVVPKKIEWVTGKSRSQEWKSRMFYKLEGEKPEDTPESILDVLSGKKPEFYFRYSRIYAFYAKYPLDIPTKARVLESWDKSRGLTVQQKRELQFQREEKMGYDFATYSKDEPDGVNTEYGEFSKILIRDNRAVSIFYIFPLRDKSLAIQTWENLLKSLKFAEK